MSLTAERLREVLHYDRATGDFVWKITGNNRTAPGFIAGAVDRTGYRSIMIDRRRYLAYRLAWLYVHGEWPTGGLDHVDNCRDHNWIGNLRPASQSQNNGNAKKHFDNTSGFKGVFYEPHRRKWRARIQLKGRRLSLGSFPTAEQAHAAYLAAAQDLFGPFARGE